MKIKFAKQWDSVSQLWKKFYPITITPAIIDADRGQRLNATLANTEEKTSIVSCTVANLPVTLSTNTYYNITDAVTSMTLTLPTITDNTKTSVVAVYFATGSSTPTVTIASASSQTISYFSDYEIAASKSYELNIMWNGTKWIVAHAVVE